MANSSYIHLPNPFTPLAFLPPDQAYQKSVTDYITTGALSILVWDILTHLQSDYKLVSRYRVNLPTIVYFVSRWSTLLYAITISVFHSAPIDDCDTLTKATCAVYHVTVSSTALLFFLRVRAIFNRNTYITVGFFTLWVIVLGGSLTSVLSATGVHIGNTKYCTFSDLKTYRSAVANITLAIFDTAIFIGITWRLSNSHLSIKKTNSADLKPRFHLFGRYLPVFTKALLHDGQKYYLVAMLANLLVVFLDFIPGVPMPYRATFLAPAIGLTNIMACRVFRHTKMRNKNKEPPIANVSTLLFRMGDSTSTPLPIHVRKQRSEDSLTMSSVSQSGPYSSGAVEMEAPSDNSCSLEKGRRNSEELGSDIYKLSVSRS
ncbi:hypothetical protein BDZ94DRAFT_1227223 [Collybia nuda]|uniref:DUF6533 domain-containing protein n=1 Tax=Collybia nuda TaxID=64659 RepID=A0A9P5XWB6_9AGAR|nr:hypothetical protein BDZ94DRAFT_1227223 [Collybia nuda]